MAKNFMAALKKLEGAVVDNYDPFSQVVSSPSPSLNNIYGGGWGLPKGFSAVLWGPPKGGKSVISHAMAGQLHKDYPEDFVIKFDTEFRESGQNGAEQKKLWGIDPDRWLAYSVSSPDLVFDRIEKEIAALCEEGMKLGMIIIDSITGIQGRRAMNADSVMTQQIGDDAKTIQDGLKRILPIQRKYKFALLMCSHQRAEMDVGEQMRGNKTKMAGANAMQHHTEYFIHVEPWKSKEGKTDLAGNKFENAGYKDAAGNAEITGHKLRVTMKDSSMGPKGRKGIITLDYHKGFVNINEEVFLVGTGKGVIAKLNTMTYGFGDKKWTGKPATLEALKDPELAAAVLRECRLRDAQGLPDVPAIEIEDD